MFYSQFILAKKGPLGTIWIAAHLERKLRKNQVADTDIGISVDSILFPEAPIALRLSSHLLLGVVRIYSKKVNYLFHDCSEALLQIKQAFRSTVVDLPPEESTAPYHSITLPETFHLDDFELPDSTYGNFVDRHISSKEQITLQDNVNNTGCSTSQFGLDERFGDGDASQIGLDLDEDIKQDLFLEKDSLGAHASDPLALDEITIRGDQSSIPMTSMDIDEERRDDKATDLSALFLSTYKHPEEKNIREFERQSSSHQGYNPQTPNLNETFSPEIAFDGSSSVPYDGPIGFGDDNPPTPYITEFDHAPSTPGLMEEAIRTSFQDNPTLSPQEKAIASSNVEPEYSNTINRRSVDHDVEVGQESTGVAEPATGSEPAAYSAKLGSGHDVVNVLLPGLDNGEAIEIQHIMLEDTGKDQERGLTSDLATESKMLTAAPSEIGRTLHEDNPEPQNISSEQNNEENAVPCPEVLPLDMALAENVHDVSVREPSCVTEVVENDEHHMHGSSDGNRTNEQSAEFVSKDAPADPQNCSSSSELPEPEKMRSASRSNDQFTNDLGEITTGKGITESDGSVDWFKKLSVRKRRLTESTLVMQNCSSTKLSSKTGLRSSEDDVPDDNDLLASILVGRRKSALRLEPTPATKATSNKRSRLSSKIQKRKVLVDDIMVLHADTIRQQLINTEDTRRVRKKAPCTRSEVWTIEKSLNEEEIFAESLLTGLSPELHRLHSQSYALEKINEMDKNDSIAAVADKVDGEIQGMSGTSLSAEAGTCKGVQYDIQEHTHSVSIVHEDEQQQNNLGNEQIQESFGIDGILVKDNSAVSSPEKCDEACRQPDKQSQQKIAQPCDGPTGMNGENVVFDGIANGETCMDQSKHEVMMEFSNREGHCDVDAAVREAEHGELAAEGASTRLQYSNSHMPTEDIKEANLDSSVDNDAVGSLNKQHDAVPGMIALDRDQLQSCSVEIGVGTEAVESAVGENYELQEITQAMDVDSNPTEVGATRDSSDFCSAIEYNDTDFLNMDEEADYDEADIDVPNPEEMQPLENSGWSSRTRGVARYLKLLFNEEYGHGRKVVAVDQLLAGKTRKEASRMFFETLVLKTRDYIDVEQKTPFDYVKIKPQMKLLKAEL